MATIAEALALGLDYHRRGDFPEAERCYREILHSDPRHVKALHLLGMITNQLGRPVLAAAYIREAIALSPANPTFHGNLGTVCQALGNLEEAVACYRQALALRPAYPEAHNNLGNALGEQGQLTEAIACFRQAMAFKPNYPDAHNNLGWALQRQGKAVEATACFRQAMALKPDYAEAHSNLGNALGEQGQFAEAMTCLRQALALKRDYAEAHNNLGWALQQQGRFAEATACFRRALAIKPDYAEAHKNLAMVCLLTGQFVEGWREYEWRWRIKDHPGRQFSQPRWDGASFDQQTLLLHAEQGLGDTLQFIRYASLAKRRGGKVVVACQGSLRPIFARCPGIDELVALDSSLPPFDLQAPLMSLPGIFGANLKSIPAEVPYLFADPKLMERWRCLAASPGLKIGINWRGRPDNPTERSRGMPLAHFEGLAQLDGVRLIGLQKHHGDDELLALGDRFAVLDLGPQTDKGAGPFMDTAAIMRNLDLVITSDTVTAHLAGALGVPTWVALPFVPDWRWLLDRDDSPWYPTMRLFRQREPGNWAEVFERLARAVRRLLAGKAPVPSILAPIAPGELVDRITILEIKSERISDPVKLRSVRIELAALQAKRDQALESSEELQALTAELRKVNETLWQVEDDIRACEAAGDFGPRFIELARSVYRHNDRRGALKRRINEQFDAEFREEKQYTSYRA